MIEPTIQLSALLLIIGTVQALFLCSLSLRHRSTLLEPSRVYATSLLSLLLLVLAVVLLEQFFITARFYTYIPHLTFALAPFHLLLGPLVLGVITAEVNPISFKFSRFHLLHLLPIVVVFLLFVPLFQLPADKKLILYYETENVALIPNNVLAYILARGLIILENIPFEEIILLGYFAVSLYLLWQNRAILGDPQSTMTGIKKGWVAALMLAYFVQLLLFTADTAIQSRMNIDATIYLNILLSSVTVLLFLGAFVGFCIFMPDRNGQPILETTAKYKNSSLSPEQTLAVSQKLMTLMEEDEIYLDTDLKLSTLAERTGYSTNIISQVINAEFAKSYTDFINSYRVSAAKERLRDPNSDALILTIAHEAGFNSKATFNAAFKKHTGTTPSQYRKSQLAIL